MLLILRFEKVNHNFDPGKRLLEPLRPIPKIEQRWQVTPPSVPLRSPPASSPPWPASPQTDPPAQTPDQSGPGYSSAENRHRPSTTMRTTGTGTAPDPPVSGLEGRDGCSSDCLRP